MRALHVPVDVMKRLTVVAAASLFAGSTAFAEVHVTLHDGLVTVVAQDAKSSPSGRASGKQPSLISSAFLVVLFPSS
jgi:hypothetical protein